MPRNVNGDYNTDRYIVRLGWRVGSGFREALDGLDKLDREHEMHGDIRLACVPNLRKRCQELLDDFDRCNL